MTGRGGERDMIGDIFAIVGETANGCTAYYAAQQLRTSRPIASRLLRQLQRRGLVEHVGHWRLTSKGREAAPRAGAEE